MEKDSIHKMKRLLDKMELKISFLQINVDELRSAAHTLREEIMDEEEKSWDALDRFIYTGQTEFTNV